MKIDTVFCHGQCPSPRGNFSVVIDGNNHAFVIGGDSDEKEYKDV
jgi:hypothetical protein